MKASNQNAFRKTSACPSSNLLLSYRTSALSAEVVALVKNHLNACEFCNAEVTLLAHYQVPAKKFVRAPELPINLRILAESIMSQEKRAEKVGSHGLLLAE